MSLALRVTKYPWWSHEQKRTPMYTKVAAKALGNAPECDGDVGGQSCTEETTRKKHGASPSPACHGRGPTDSGHHRHPSPTGKFGRHPRPARAGRRGAAVGPTALRPPPRGGGGPGAPGPRGVDQRRSPQP